MSLIKLCFQQGVSRTRSVRENLAVFFEVLAAALIGLVFLAAGANGPNDSYGRPLGTGSYMR